VKNCAATRVREQIVSILESWGMDREIVRTTAEVMVETDLAGVDSHGVSMLMDYESSKSKGKLNLKARPRIVKQTAVTALIDADAGLGHPAAVMGMKLAIEKARAMGAGAMLNWDCKGGTLPPKYRPATCRGQ
jgi:LDH2 family malate/lactate/ureidoglycolate dehydrogenase